MPKNLKIVTILATGGEQRTLKEVQHRIDGQWVSLAPKVGTRLDAIALRNSFQSQGL